MVDNGGTSGFVNQETSEHPEVDVERAFRIISMAKDESSFILQEENLKIIMGEIKKLERYANELVIISVVGAFRTGKSFLLSMFIRYLEYCESLGQEIPSDKRGEAKWLKNGKFFSHGNIKNPEKTEPGFAWAHGRDRTTTGMYMYGKPFLRTIPGTTDKAVVLLMDTQGMFDMETTKVLTASIFGLSTLISSYQIMNVMNQLQENILQELHFFSGYSVAALRELARREEEVKTAEIKKEAPFQTLEILVRDYPHFSSEETAQGWLTGMPSYLQSVLDPRGHDEGMRKQIKETFQNIVCFLLPHPGLKMIAKQWSGDLDVAEKNFLEMLDHYVRTVFEENLVVKKIRNQTITSLRLEEFIKAFIGIFKDGKMPQTKGLVQAIGDATNMCAKDDALKLYNQEMTQRIQGSFLKSDQLKDAHETSKKLSFSSYDSVAVFGDREATATVKKSLESQVKAAYKEFKDQNKRKMHSNLEKYVIPVLAAIVAYVLDYISDFTCDSWLGVCRQFSTLAFIFYFFVVIVLLYEFVWIYRDSGIGNVGIVATSFGTSVIERVKTINDDYIHPTMVKFQNAKEKED